MNGADILTTIAELAVGVTGFSGIVIAFNRAPGRLSDLEAYRILILFSTSLAALFFPLVPFALFHLGWSDLAIWRTGNALIVTFEIVFLLIFLGPVRRFWRRHREIFNIWLYSFLAVGHVVSAVTQFFSAIGWSNRQALSIFLFGLLWLLFHSAFQFGRMIFVQPGSGETDSGR